MLFVLHNYKRVSHLILNVFSALLLVEILEITATLFVPTVSFETYNQTLFSYSSCSFTLIHCSALFKCINKLKLLYYFI
jgi:hypothetical protein